MTHTRAVFLDRDGTLIRERDYLSDPAEVELLPGVPEALRMLVDMDFALVVVTNQSGIARGLFGEDRYRAVADRIDALLAAEAIRLDAVYHCPHHPRFTGPCECRKPEPGMYLRAARDLGLRMSGSWFAGDRVRDLIAARPLGGRGVLVRTGYGRAEESGLPDGFEAVDDLLAAARLIGRLDGGARGVSIPSRPASG